MPTVKAHRRFRGVLQVNGHSRNYRRVRQRIETTGTCCPPAARLTQPKQAAEYLNRAEEKTGFAVKHAAGRGPRRRRRGRDYDDYTFEDLDAIAKPKATGTTLKTRPTAAWRQRARATDFPPISSELELGGTGIGIHHLVVKAFPTRTAARRSNHSRWTQIRCTIGPVSGWPSWRSLLQNHKQEAQSDAECPRLARSRLARSSYGCPIEVRRKALLRDSRVRPSNHIGVLAST